MTVWLYAAGGASLLLVLYLIKRAVWPTNVVVAKNKSLFTQVSAIIAKPLANSALHVDLPRFARKVVIHLPSKTIQHPDETLPSLQQLFLNMGQFLEGRQGRDAMATQFDSHYSLAQSSNVDFGGFLTQVVEPHFKRSFNVLRCICQDIVAPAIMILKYKFANGAPFKDLRGQWWIHVYFTDQKVIRVVHKKREQSAELDKPEKYFEFEWNLMLELDSATAKLVDSSLYIADVKFGDQTDAETQRTVKELSSEFMLKHK